MQPDAGDKDSALAALTADILTHVLSRADDPVELGLIDRAAWRTHRRKLRGIVPMSGHAERDCPSCSQRLSRVPA